MCYDGHFGGIISGFKQISDLKGILISIILGLKKPKLYFFYK